MLAICGVHVSVHSLWVFIAHHRATLSTSFRLWELLGVQVSELRPYRVSDTHELVHREQGTTVPYAGSLSLVIGPPAVVDLVLGGREGW